VPSHTKSSAKLPRRRLETVADARACAKAAEQRVAAQGIKGISIEFMAGQSYYLSPLFRITKKFCDGTKLACPMFLFGASFSKVVQDLVRGVRWMEKHCTTALPPR
jgi:hypothetical protein